MGLMVSRVLLLFFSLKSFEFPFQKFSLFFCVLEFYYWFHIEKLILSIECVWLDLWAVNGKWNDSIILFFPRSSRFRKIVSINIYWNVSHGQIFTNRSFCTFLFTHKKDEEEEEEVKLDYFVVVVQPPTTKIHRPFMFIVHAHHNDFLFPF